MLRLFLTIDLDSFGVKNVGYPLLRAVLEDSFVGTVFIPDDGAFDKLASQIGLSKDQIINASPSFWDQVSKSYIFYNSIMCYLLPLEEDL